MEKSSFIDSLFFEGGNMSQKGTEFLNSISHFRKSASSLGKEYPPFVTYILDHFSTEEVLRAGSEKKNWLMYNFKGFPLIAVLTKITSIQANVAYAKQEFLNAIITQK